MARTVHDERSSGQRPGQCDGACVLAVHVLTYSRELLRDVTLDTMRAWRRELEADLRDRWVEPLIAEDVQHRTLLVEDDSPAGGLLGVADREHADLIIVGAKDTAASPTGRWAA